MLRNKEKEQRSLDNDATSVESEQDLTPPCRNSKLIRMYHTLGSIQKISSD